MWVKSWHSEAVCRRKTELPRKMARIKSSSHFQSARVEPLGVVSNPKLVYKTCKRVVSCNLFSVLKLVEKKPSSKKLKRNLGSENRKLFSLITFHDVKTTPLFLEARKFRCTMVSPGVPHMCLFQPLTWSTKPPQLLLAFEV